MQNDFVAYGTFKTKLGRFDSDINLKINKAGVPAYSGKLSTNDFALGDLLDISDIGRTTLTADVKGSGDAMKNLNEAVNAKITYLNFKGYNYNNLTVNGTFLKKLASAKISINDKNIKLNLDGSIDLGPALPVYDFAADVQDAHLHTLKLLKDTITLSTKMKTRFDGNSLQNFEGSIDLSPLRVIDPRHNYLLIRCTYPLMGTVIQGLFP